MSTASTPTPPTTPQPSHASFMTWMQDLGDIMSLVENAPVQGQYPLAILRARVFASLWHGQYLVLRQNHRAVAFVNWAWLSDALDTRYRQSQCYLAPEDWQSGPHLWFMEILGGSEHLQTLIQRLRDIIPPGTQAHWHEVHAVGGSSATLRSVRFGVSPSQPK